MGAEITRREALSLLGGGTVAALAGCADDNRDSIDLDDLENVLEIPSKTTHAISSTDSETYDSVLWEPNGTLELATEATIELTNIDN